MLSLDTATFIVQQVTFLLAYIVSVTLTGAFTAWLTDKMGDSTGRDFGYMTLNPLVHINLLGMLFIVWAKIGFGNRIPIDPSNIRAPYRWLKVAVAYYADAVACLVLGFIALFAVLVLFGPIVPGMIKTLLYRCSYDLTHMDISQMCPTFSSGRITAIFILLATAYLNVVLSAIRFITNSFYLYLELRSGNRQQDSMQNYYMTFVVPLILLFLFGSLFIGLVVDLLSAVAYLLTRLMF